MSDKEFYGRCGMCVALALVANVGQFGLRDGVFQFAFTIGSAGLVAVLFWRSMQLRGVVK